MKKYFIEYSEEDETFEIYETREWHSNSTRAKSELIAIGRLSFNNKHCWLIKKLHR